MPLLDIFVVVVVYHRKRKITNAQKNPHYRKCSECGGIHLETKTGDSLSFRLLWDIYSYPVSKINKQKTK